LLQDWRRAVMEIGTVVSTLTKLIGSHVGSSKLFNVENPSHQIATDPIRLMPQEVVNSYMPPVTRKLLFQYSLK